MSQNIVELLKNEEGIVNELFDKFKLLITEIEVEKISSLFKAFISDKKPTLFILAGNDPGTEIFQHYFQNNYFRVKCQHSNFDELVDVFLVENANHVYTLFEWQETLINKVCTWIETRF